jgi:hypothetical protein
MMSNEEQIIVHQQLEQLQKKDWKELSLDEKKAGASRPVSVLLPLSNPRAQLIMWPLDLMDRELPSPRLAAASKYSWEPWGASALRVCYTWLPGRWVRCLYSLNPRPCGDELTPWACPAPPPPKTISKEWEEASNERALEQKLNPITGELVRVLHISYSAFFSFLFGVYRHVADGSFAGISSEGYAGKGFVTHK